MLQARKDVGIGKRCLINPSEEVVGLCTIAEKVIRIKWLKKTDTNFRLKLKTKESMPRNLFQHISDLDFIPLHFEADHKAQLIDNILEIIFSLRLNHEIKSFEEKKFRINLE